MNERENEDGQEAGYSFTRLYSTNQEFNVLSPDEVESLPEEDIGLEIGWGWRILDVETADELAERWDAPPDLNFEVAVEVLVEGPADEPVRASATLVGQFHLAGGDAPPIPLLDFVRLNAVAAIYPYARETIEELTSRGPFDATVLPLANVVAFMRDFDSAASYGAMQLADHPELADALGVEVPDDRTPIDE